MSIANSLDLATQSLRERNKRDKLARIRSAARELFETKGYEGTTIRDVAKLADVGQGTVSSYAPGKRELVFLVVNEEHPAAVEAAFARVSAEQSLIDQLMIAFGEGYRFARAQGVMGRFMLRELTFEPLPDLPPQETKFNETRLRYMRLIVGLIDRAKARGEVRKDVDTSWAARVLFAIFRSETRIALSIPQYSPEEGMDALQLSLSMVLSGLLTRRNSASKP